MANDRRRLQRRVVVALSVVAWVVAVGAQARSVQEDQRDSRRQLEQRFEVRADNAARFLKIYAQEVLKREQAQAAALLDSPHVTQREFDAAVAGGGYQAAVLLDARGRFLRVAPSKPELIGTLAPRHPHLVSALGGTQAVSKIEYAIAGGAPIVAFATAFDTPQGRRVFSGGYDVRRGPLTAYLPGVSAVHGSRADLIDADGAVIASSRDAHSPLRLTAAQQRFDRSVVVDGQTVRVAVRPVSGTPWRLVVSSPEAKLYAPLSTGGRRLQWGGLAIFVLASLIVAGLLARLTKARSLLVADVAKRQDVERELLSAQTRLRQAFDEAPIGMALIDLDGRWRQVNRALCTMLRYTEAELMRLNRADIVHPDDLPPASSLEPGDTDPADMEIRMLDALGGIVWTEVSRSIVRDETGAPLYYIAQIQDITERREFSVKLAHMADHDVLTGLFNRRRFEQELDRQVAYTERYATPATLLMLDLDNFKYVNDTLGHAMGDELLVRVAAALRERLRTTDVITRLGGDEFAIILPETDIAAAQRVAASLLVTIKDDGLVQHESCAIQVTASIGIAAIETDVAVTPNELMMRADGAMYEAKEAGRGRFAVHHPGATARLTDTVTWADAIRRALANDGFVLYQQPILDLRTNEIARHELLLRMVGADGEHILPATFLYVAERFGLIEEIDAWVIRQAVTLIDEQQRLGRRLVLEVNLAGPSLTSPLVMATIEHELQRSGIDRSCLIFEVLEAAAISNIQKARSFAERIAELGCGFALDNFGAGFGSFYYLKHLPFDVLKIDGEFIRNLSHSIEDQVVVKSVAQIATKLGKTTVAEFVEDEATLELLRSYGVDYAQGYGIGHPQPVCEWLASAV